MLLGMQNLGQKLSGHVRMLIENEPWNPFELSSWVRTPTLSKGRQ